MTYNELSDIPVSFDEAADKLVELDSGSHPSEFHGLLCGGLAGGGLFDVRDWLKQGAELIGCESLESTFEVLFSRLYQQTRQQLAQSDFSIPLLLPDDEEALEKRTEALGCWCQGFLSGFGEAAAGKSFSDDTEGALSDFAQIAQIQPESGDDNEAERFYMEISEFIKVALLAIYGEINESDQEIQTP